MDKEAVWQVMRLYRVGGKLLKAVHSFNEDIRAQFRIGNELHDWFSIKVGLFQGCVMSLWLFILYMDGKVREVRTRSIRRGTKFVGEGD